MRIIALLAVVAGAIWAAKTGKLKTSKIEDLAGSATDEVGRVADEAADHIRSHTH